MRFIYGQGWAHIFDETNGEGDDNGAGGGAAGAGDAGGGADDDAGADAGAAGAGAAAAKGDGKGGAAAAGEPKSMDEAIKIGLEKTAPKVEKTEEEKAAEATAAAAAGKHANGTPKKNDKGEDLDEAGKVVPKAAPKTKTAAELQLSKEQLAALRPESRGRFAEVITTLKARETEIATLTEQMKPLAEARDTMIGILEETKTSSDQLSAYLEFNRMLQSTDPKELESALGMIEAQRTALYKVLGREPEGGGVDLLADFPDLKEKVAEAHMTREAALEVAAARRQRAAAEQQGQQQRTQQQSQQQVAQARENAVKEITTWCGGLATKDIDYKAKEEKLLEQVDEVIKTYPPNQWLATLKLLYTGIVIQKQAAAPNKGNQPLRPSGAKPGAKAPQNMFEAMWGAEKAS